MNLPEKIDLNRAGIDCKVPFSNPFEDPVHDHQVKTVLRQWQRRSRCLNQMDIMDPSLPQPFPCKVDPLGYRFNGINFSRKTRNGLRNTTVARSDVKRDRFFIEPRSEERRVGKEC